MDAGDPGQREHPCFTSSTLSPGGALSIEVGVDITDQTPKPLTDDLIAAADRVIVLGRDAQVQPIDGTPVEYWDTDEPSERGIDGIDRMRLVRDDIARRVDYLAGTLTRASETPVAVGSLAMRAEVLKGHLDGLLLSMLEPGPIHGYAVIDSLRARSGGAFDLPTGTVYPALHRLERGGLVRGSWSVGTGRRRRVYELTAAGRAALTEQRVSWWQFAGAVSTVMGGGGAPPWTPATT